MAKRLVFDRTINIAVNVSQTIAVPTDELWKVTATGDITMNRQYSLKSTISHLIGQGSNIGCANSVNNCQLTGIAFKILEA